MKTVKQNQTDNHQKEGSKREDKKKTNIKFNSVIFFQVGLVVALVASAWAMNLKIGERTKVNYGEPPITIIDQAMIDYIVEPDPVPIKEPIAKLTQPAQKLIIDIVEVVPDDRPILITPLITKVPTSVVPDTPIIKPPVVDTPPIDHGSKNMNAVEFVPIFPGCESAGDKDAKIACMSEKIGRFVGRKFNTSVADHGTTGTQKIYVQFKIDKNGNVADIIARAPDKNLEKEAQRVISKLPEFTPGKMGDVAVDVMYMLPINFQIDN